MLVRLAAATDAEAIRAIYNLEVLESTVTFDLVPRSHDEQRAWLAAHAGAHPAVVAVDGVEILGVGSGSPYPVQAPHPTAPDDSACRVRGGPGMGSCRSGRPVPPPHACRVKVKVSGTNTTPPAYTAAR